MGELVSTQGTSVDMIRALTWSKIKIMDSTHYTVLIIRPKVVDKASPVGHVLDLWAYPSDSCYCPIFYLNILHNRCWKPGKGCNENLIFEWSSGVPVTLTAINKYLATLLTPMFKSPAVKFSCHSYRAGLPSMMATNPDIFSEQECQISGGWWSTGIAQGSVMKNFHSFLDRH